MVENTKRQQQVKQFIEKFGLVAEKWSMPRMAGRILGYLMICEPPLQSAAQLAEAIGSSLGSISSMQRLLIHNGLVKKVGVSGESSIYLQLTDDFMVLVLQLEMEPLITLLRSAKHGLEILKDKSAKQRQRLQNMYDLSRELSIITARWPGK